MKNRTQLTLTKWNMFSMPEDMKGKAFLDVGCWEGYNCVEALRRGASHAVGIDLCTSPELADNVRQHGIVFLQMDVLSEKFWQLPRFDVVLCSGVLYHIEHPLNLIFRLRHLVKEFLFLETAYHKLSPEVPLLLFHPDSDLSENPSNWWTPNERCLHEMLRAASFDEIQTVHERHVDNRIGRLALRARPCETWAPLKLLPRKSELMSVFGGSRTRAKKK